MIKERFEEMRDYVRMDRKVIGIWGLCIGLVVVLVGWVFVPNIRNYVKLRKREKLLKVKVEKYRRKYTQLININETKLQEKVNMGLEMLPLYHNAPLIIGILSRLGADENVILSDVVFSPGEVASDSVELANDKAVKGKTKTIKNKLPKELKIDKMEIQLRVQGELDNVRRFLASLEKIKPLIRLKNLSLILEGEKKNMVIASSSGVKKEVVAHVGVEFFAAQIPQKMPSIEDPVYVVPVEKEEQYQQLLKEYRSFSQVKFTVPKLLKNQRKTPFFYEESE